MRQRRLVKIRFELASDDPYGSETLWAEEVASGRYRLRNSPFYARDVSAEDIVFADAATAIDDAAQCDPGSPENPLAFQGISMRGGHSTYRLWRRAEVSDERFLTVWKGLQLLGCSYEQAGASLFAVDIPPHVDIHAAYRSLEEGESSGVWEFEEAHCGHSVRKRS
jgi:hypothetical protein